MNYSKPYVIYTDGIYDLFHRGHVESLKKCKELFEGNIYLIVGVISDNDATNYKRPPIYNEDDRYSIIENIKYVDKIIKGAPLIITEDFLNTYNIDYVVHGFSNSQDNNKQDDFFKIPKQLNKFFEIDYYSKISTTDIIKKINENNQTNNITIDEDQNIIEKHGGQDIYEDLSKIIDDFSVTTNYLGPCQSALYHIKENIDIITHYPKEDQEPYKTKIINFLNSTNSNLLLGNGASELIDLIIRLFNTKKIDKKFFVSKTQYMEYERSCVLYNYKKTDTVEDADMVCIINPCNPTGIYFTTNEIFEIITKCKDNSVIIIDESMMFWVGKNFRDKSMVKEQIFIQDLIKEKNIKLFIIHSYTKIFSCTGIRFGTVLCPDKKTYNYIKRFQNPWNCNILALEYISKCIEDDEYLEQCVF